MMDYSDIESQVQSLYKSLMDRLDDDDIELIDKYLKHDEWGLAFEEICASLRQSSSVVSPDEYERLSMTGSVMQLPDSYWTVLMHQVE